MTLFWFAMMLICCVIVSFRFVISATTSSRFVSLPSRSDAAVAVALADGSFCIDLDALDRVLNDRWTSRTFALGFLGRPFDGAAGWVRGGVDDTRSGVEAAIGALAPRSVGHKGRLAAGAG